MSRNQMAGLAFVLDRKKEAKEKRIDQTYTHAFLQRMGVSVSALLVYQKGGGSFLLLPLIYDKTIVLKRLKSLD